MIKSKKGFTLVELLVVIVILAIILVIAVPKVIEVITDSKKATLESTAKMIASSVEKAKMQNKVLGKNETITCESVAKLNNVDYESCSITFVGNDVKVTLVGKGKFSGLNVCAGTKTSSSVQEGECETAVTYIKNLLAKEETLDNGLIVDDTADANIRYAGASVNNKVYFNCLDIDKNGVSYGKEGYDYVNSCETWRIIGVFNVEDVNGNIDKRIKIVRGKSLLNTSWDSSASNINGYYGVNQWGESIYSDGTFYEGSDLMRILNTYYLGTTNICTYCNNPSQEICSNDCTTIFKKLNNNSINMIDNVVWHTGGFSKTNMLPSEAYVLERPTTIGNNGEGTGCLLNQCSDNVKRTVKWLGKVGLVYVSDYAYSGISSCEDILSSTCGTDNWMKYFDWSWTITPNIGGNLIFTIWGNISNGLASHAPRAVYPTVYLKTITKIKDGNGYDQPYILEI